jgi:hypothetical protein
MATQVQLRRGTAAQVAAWTGAVAELGYATDTKRLAVGDGVTAGGSLLPLLSEVQKTSYNWATLGVTLGANPFTTSLSSTTVTVNQTAHALTTGNSVTFAGATTFNNVTISGAYTVTVVNGSSYTITAGTTANANGSGGGSAVTANSSDALQATLSPAPAALAAGLIVEFKAAVGNTSTTPVMIVNGLAAVAIQKNGGALAAADITAGQTYFAVYDGTAFQLLGVKPSTGASNPGATVTSPMSSNLVLTSASRQVQTVFPNAAGLSIQLPDATTFSVGGAAVFELNNQTTSGSFPVQIIDSASALLGWVLPGGRTQVHLDSIAAATGNWRLQSGDRAQDLGWYEWGDTRQQTTTSYGGNQCNVQLDSQYGIRFYGSNSTPLNCVGYKIGDPLTAIGAASVAITTSVLGFDAVRLSATEALVTWYDASSNNTKVATVDLNTGTLAVTLNTAVVVDATTPTTTYISCDAISSSLAILLYNVGAASCKAVTVSVAAGACTVNTPATVNGTGALNTPQDIVVLSSTLAHAVMQQPAQTLNFYRLALSGSTISSVSSAVKQASRGDCAITKVSATVSAVAYDDAATTTAVYCNILTDTGSTVTANEITVAAADVDTATGFGPKTFCVNNFQAGIFGVYRVASSSGQLQMHLLRPSASAAPMSPPIPIRIHKNSPGPSRSMPPQMRSFSGVGLFGLNVQGSALVEILTPLCIA